MSNVDSTAGQPILSERALDLLLLVFNTENGQLTFPAGVSRQIIEIEDLAKAEKAKRSL